MIGSLVVIEWLDSVHQSTGWTRRSELEFNLDSDLVHRSAGFLVHESPKSIGLCQSHRMSTGMTGFIDAVIEIPRVALLSIHVITEHEIQSTEAGVTAPAEVRRGTQERSAAD